MNKKLSLLTLLKFFLISSVVAQATDSDFMRSTGKIYVVVAVVAVIFFAIIAFLIYLERRISKLEKSEQNGEQAG